MDLPGQVVGPCQRIFVTLYITQKIQIGDQIIFTNRDNLSQTTTVKVVGLLHYATFHDLFSHNDPQKFGGESVEWLENQINEFYSIEDQQLHGVVGIEFILI